MKINDDHLYHGAALTQVAEHPTFKAINAFSKNGTRSRSAFLVSTDIGLYLKYASKPKKPFHEFVFTFNRENIAELETLCEKTNKVFLALVCVDARQICCVPYHLFTELLDARKKSKGGDEDAYTVLVTCATGKRFRIYVNVPGRRKQMLGEKVIPRDNFPETIFDKS